MATLANHSGSSPAAFPATHKSVVAIPISQETKCLAPGHWQLAEVWPARPLQGIRNACRAPSVPTFAPGGTLAFCKCSATGTRTRVARVRAEYPNQLDYSGCCIDFSYGRMQQLHSRHIAASAGFLLFWLASFLGAPPDAYAWHGAKASLSHICLRSWATLRHAWTVASTSCRSYQ